MSLQSRLQKLRKGIVPRSAVPRFNTVQALPVDRANGMAPGLYRNGPPGSTAGLLVYDLAKGRPLWPDDSRPPWGMLIEVENATLDTIL